jgi:hypothetical protein
LGWALLGAYENSFEIVDYFHYISISLHLL